MSGRFQPVSGYRISANFNDSYSNSRPEADIKKLDSTPSHVVNAGEAYRSGTDAIDPEVCAFAVASDVELLASAHGVHDLLEARVFGSG